MKPPKQRKKQFDNYIKYSNIPIQMIVVIGGGIWGGVELDKLTNIEFPVFTLILSIVSVFLGIYIAIKDFLKK